LAGPVARVFKGGVRGEAKGAREHYPIMQQLYGAAGGMDQVLRQSIKSLTLAIYVPTPRYLYSYCNTSPPQHPSPAIPLSSIIC